MWGSQRAERAHRAQPPPSPAPPASSHSRPFAPRPGNWIPPVAPFRPLAPSPRPAHGPSAHRSTQHAVRTRVTHVQACLLRRPPPSYGLRAPGCRPSWVLGVWILQGARSGRIWRGGPVVKSHHLSASKTSKEVAVPSDGGRCSTAAACVRARARSHARGCLSRLRRCRRPPLVS